MKFFTSVNPSKTQEHIITKRIRRSIRGFMGAGRIHFGVLLPMLPKSSQEKRKHLRMLTATSSYPLHHGQAGGSGI